MKLYPILIFCCIFLLACSRPEAEKIITKSINFHGMEKLNNATLKFNFRNFKLKATQSNGKFIYERMFTDSTGKVHDILNNDGFTRIVNGKALKLNAKKTAAYTESVNAVFYFTYLPLKLNDPSVIKKYLGETTLQNKLYHKVEISFKQQGGGKDYDDVFYYYFDKEDYSMDFLSYSTGGNRFRAVLKVHDVGGVRLQDYINYQSPAGDSITPIRSYDSLYRAGKLRELSRIEISGVEVD